MKHLYNIPYTESGRFKIEYGIKTKLDNPIDEVWYSLSNPHEILTWDSNLLDLKGVIRQDSKFLIKSKLSPNQVFNLKVSTFNPPTTMIWESGFWPIFKGVRSYTLKEHEGATLLTIIEVFEGLALPFIKHKLPDCKTMFGTLIKDLKLELKNNSHQ